MYACLKYRVDFGNAFLGLADTPIVGKMGRCYLTLSLSHTPLWRIDLPAVEKKMKKTQRYRLAL